jgi:hypothetical protein
MPYQNYIKKLRLNKQADLLIQVPIYTTEDGFKITDKFIRQLLKQQEIKFDLLIIDNQCNYFKKLLDKYPWLNYLSLVNNYGSGGAHYLGAKIAIKKHYQYLIFCDNDAYLLQPFSLSKLFIKLNSHPQLGAIVPQAIENLRWQKTDCLVDSYAFHYFLVKTEVLKKTGLHPFSLFALGDDLCLTAIVSTKSQILMDSQVFYAHPVFKPSNYLSFSCFYLAMKAYLYVLLVEKRIAIRFKLKIFLLIIKKALWQFILCLVNGEVDKYFSTWKYISRDFFTLKTTPLSKLPKSQYCFVQTKKKKTDFYFNRFGYLLPFAKSFRVSSKYTKSSYYYRIQKC